MNRTLYIIFVSFFVSCASLNSDNNKENTTRESSPVITDSLKESNQKINSELKEALRGIWASKEYRELLFERNSITAAQKEITIYTDLVFDGEHTLHAYKPSLMEEDYLILKPDSSLFYFNGKVIFKIKNIENGVITLQDSNDKVMTFNRVVEKADVFSMYAEITKGSSAIENEWISGKYTIKLDRLEFVAELQKNGIINSDSDLKKVYSFSYLDKDILEYKFKNDSIVSYQIKSYSDTLIVLQGIENITEIDMPLVLNGKIGFMNRH